MTLDEHIWEEERFIKLFEGVAYDTRLHDENGELMWKAEQYEKSQHEHEERKALLEELKNLRVELEKNSKELEVYKKALDLAINDIKKICESNEKSINDCKCCALHGSCPLYGSCEKSMNGGLDADYLQIAREEND